MRNYVTWIAETVCLSFGQQQLFAQPSHPPSETYQLLLIVFYLCYPSSSWHYSSPLLMHRTLEKFHVLLLLTHLGVLTQTMPM